MINKKLLAVASLAAVVSASSAFAKTEGNYVGVDLLATTYKLNNDDGNRVDGTDLGLGVNYKYAVNFNSFFVAPGVFLNYNNADIRTDGDKNELKYSYGIKADFGYDITDKFASFLTFGYQENRNKFAGENDTLEALVYGVGVKYSVTSNVDLGLAYEYDVYTKSTIPNSINPSVIRLGGSYKF